MELDLIIARCNAEQNIENSEIQKMIACISYFMKQIVIKITSMAQYQQSSVKEQLKQVKDYIDENNQAFQTQVLQLFSKVGQEVREFVAKQITIAQQQNMKLIRNKNQQKYDNVTQLYHKLELNLFEKLKSQSENIRNYFNEKLTQLSFYSQANSQSLQARKLKSQQLTLFQQLEQANKQKLNSNNKVNKNILALSWVDPKCTDFKKIKFSVEQPEELAVQKLSYIFGKVPLKNNFELTIYNKKSIISGIGLIDSSYSTFPNCLSLQNVIWYQPTGCLQKGSVLQKISTQGYQQGSIIKMIVNLHLGFIEWQTSAHTKFQTTFQKLKDSKIKWVPLIIMSYYQKVRLKETFNQQKYYKD